MKVKKCKCGGYFDKYGEHRMCQDCGFEIGKEKTKFNNSSAGNTRGLSKKKGRSLSKGGPEKKWY